MIVQKFKTNDLIETKVTNVFLPSFDSIETDFDTFYDESYESFQLGDILFETQRDYIASVISNDAYRRSFLKIHELSDRIGTFETYLTIFKAVWGDDVVIEFEIPGPGVLNINVSNLGVEQYDWESQTIFGLSILFHNMVDHNGDQILFQQTAAIAVQEGINRFVKMISIHGIETTCTLVF